MAYLLQAREILDRLDWETSNWLMSVAAGKIGRSSCFFMVLLGKKTWYDLIGTQSVLPSRNQTWQSKIPELNGGVNRKIIELNGWFSSKPCLMTPEGYGLLIIVSSTIDWSDIGTTMDYLHWGDTSNHPQRQGKCAGQSYLTQSCRRFGTSPMLDSPRWML